MKRAGDKNVSIEVKMESSQLIADRKWFSADELAAEIGAASKARVQTILNEWSTGSDPIKVARKQRLNTHSLYRGTMQATELIRKAWVNWHPPGWMEQA